MFRRGQQLLLQQQQHPAAGLLLRQQCHKGACLILYSLHDVSDTAAGVVIDTVEAMLVPGPGRGGPARLTVASQGTVRCVRVW